MKSSCCGLLALVVDSADLLFLLLLFSKGRCAKFTSHGKSFTGWCPDGHWDKGVYHDGYSGAACISLLAVLGRHHCS